MATYRVAFGGKWQGKFDDLADAVEWAKEVSETGRITWVVEHRMARLRSRLRAVFPEERREEAERLWGERGVGGGFPYGPDPRGEWRDAYAEWRDAGGRGRHRRGR